MRESPRQDATRARRKSVLDAALDCFSEYGLEGTTVQHIQKRAECSIGSLYHHFGSKEGLAQALIEEFLSAATSTRHAVFESTHGIRDVLEAYTREMLALALRYRDTLAFAFSIWFGRSSLKNLIKRTEEYDEIVRQEWITLLSSRGLGDRVAEVTIQAYWAMLMHELMKVVQCPEFSGCTNSIADEMATLVLHGSQAFAEGKVK